MKTSTFVTQLPTEAVIAAADELSELLGTALTPADALPSTAVEAARTMHLEQLRFHAIWHRVWGVRLKSEVIETTRRLADVVSERATLVWVWWDHEKTWRSVPVAFTVPAREALRRLPQHLGPAADEVGPGGINSDLLLVSAEGRSGLHLDYTHHADRDEYEMLVWGAFAHPVAPPRP